MKRTTTGIGGRSTSRRPRAAPSNRRNRLRHHRDSGDHPDHRPDPLLRASRVAATAGGSHASQGEGCILTVVNLMLELARAVGDEHVLVEPELRAPYERDYTGRYGGQAQAVVRPANGAEVAEVMRICAEYGAPVVPQGGNTGLVGGGVPRGGEVLLSTARLTQVGTVDEI